MNKDYASAYDMIDKQIDNAKILIANDIRARLAPRFKGMSVIENGVSGFFKDDQKVVSSQATYLVGKQIEVDEYPYLEFFLSKVGLQVATTGNKSVFVYDLIQDKLLDTITVSCTSGKVSYADVYKSYPTNGQRLNLFICWLADVNYYRTGGYKVITASSGEQALEIFDRRMAEIALVILDLIMPGAGGKRCLADLLRIDPDVRVIIASGLSSNGLTTDENGTGARGFVMKPYDAKEILRAIRKVLDQGHL